MDISIIVPVYNVEDFIERCVLSIINQVYSDIKIECILVDDNSPDLSLKKAIRLIDQYSGDIIFRIILISICRKHQTKITGKNIVIG